MKGYSEEIKDDGIVQCFRGMEIHADGCVISEGMRLRPSEIIAHEAETELRAIGPKPIAPPDNPMIYNRRRPDGTYPPIAGFFDRKKGAE